MAISTTFAVNKGTVLATFIDTAGGGGRMSVNMDKFAGKMTAQRITGTGTYTVEGSNDGANWGALSTAIAAKNDANVITIPDAPKYIGVTIAAAAATVVIFGLDLA